MYQHDAHKRKLLLLLIISGVFILLIIFSISIITPKKPAATPSHTDVLSPTAVISQPGSLSPLQKSTINAPLSSDLQQRPDFLGKQTLPTGETEYSFTSEIGMRPNIVLTDQTGMVVFERIMIPQDPDTSGYALISDYKNKYGQPELDLAGSHFYDWAIRTYIYASKGFALVGNPHTDEVFEIQTFSPMTTEEYRTKFGQDIDLNAEPDKKEL